MSLMPGEPREAVVDGEPVRYYEAGSGPAVVLLHGLGGAAAVWYRNVPELAERHTVYVPELWGPGRLTQRDPLTPQTGVRFISGFLDAVGRSDAHLVGGSLGGLIAGFAAIERPERVRSLTLTGTAGLGGQIALSQRLLCLPLVGELLFRPSRRRVRRMLRALLLGWDAGVEELVDELYARRREPGVPRQMLAVLRGGVDARGVKRSVQLLPRLGNVAVPTLLVWGRHDPMFPLTLAERAVNLIPAARLHVVEESRHWPYLERPGEFNRVLLEFIAAAETRLAA